MIPFIGSSCVLCNTTVYRKISLCVDCEADLLPIPHACQYCGIPLNDSSQICGQCIKSLPSVDYNVSVYHYELPIDYLIAQLKFNQQLSYAAILGFLLKKKLVDMQPFDLPEVILPVPLHANRLVKRGFNQSLEIAKVVSKGLAIPIDSTFIRRNKATNAQSELDIEQRKRNIKNCFVLENSNERMPAYQHVVIIDDVVTTGATSNELAALLKKSGVEKVGVWSIARATLHI